jgi:hypothetical protein
MAKKRIAVVSYNLTTSSPLTQDAVVFRDTLNATGLYDAELVHQWAFDETQGPPTFKPALHWTRFQGVVICNFYRNWNLRELILSQLPVICANDGYADDLGIGEAPQEHLSEDDFNVVNNTHPITSGTALGSIDVGSPIWTDSVSTHNHHVDVLVQTLGGRAVLTAHKTHKLVYFGWYRLSQASSGSPVLKWLTKSAQWAF